MTSGPKIHRLIQQPRLWQAMLLPLLILILFLATTSQPDSIPSSANDKVNHIAAFAALGVLVHWSYPRAGWITSFILLIGYGFAIEVIQAFIPTREFSLLDLLADAVGAVLGLGFGYLLRRQVAVQAGTDHSQQR